MSTQSAGHINYVRFQEQGEEKRDILYENFASFENEEIKTTYRMKNDVPGTND